MTSMLMKDFLNENAVIGEISESFISLRLTDKSDENHFKVVNGENGNKLLQKQKNFYVGYDEEEIKQV